ncbi:MAG: MBL fold metallo-hydrolase [Euryarchaeota archaeon]|jgi:ribonuclease BN (tRNA processing enzyme)|nr:MBL fold metallo-hydrolase [Euryarchaeota archaeon]MBT5453639.1 MBL fold metallo-hydrolase [Euryarchaeota archaeon]
MGLDMTPRIDVLGTGNAFLPNGRHHSFSVFDGKHIIDAPPTALASLRRAGIAVSDIESVFVTHIHGDHVFGFPFLLLERKYISDREGTVPLRVIGSPTVKVRLTELCHLAFPGSLESILESVEWVEDAVGTTDDGWSWERFEVHHDDAVDPYGYRFENTDGVSFVHSGDSGPCDTLYNAIARSDIAILEMGFPDWVPSTHHHKPKDVEALAQQCSTPLIITHTFVDDITNHPKILSDSIPSHPPHVSHISDETRLVRNNGQWVISNLDDA